VGNATWDSGQYKTYTDSIRNKTREDIFSQADLHADLNPKNIKVRESVDSIANPNSTPIIIGCDETGSMGKLAEIIIRHGLGKVFTAIYDHKPVTDPHIMCLGLGDSFTDQAPLQMTQFEADVKALTTQVEEIYLEGNGGGNGGESYLLAWWAAVNKTLSDAIMKRGRKGYLFTIGDECCHTTIPSSHITKFLGVGSEGDISAKEILAEAQRFWHVFHLIVQPVPYQEVYKSWKTLLGDNAIPVENPEMLPEVIVSIIRLTEGQTNVTADYDHETRQVVTAATQRLLPAAR